MSAYKISPDVPVDVMGFSQGAALVYTLLLKHPQRIRRAAALAGFLPADAKETLHPELLAGKQVFIAHGTQDATIPVSRALQAIDVLKDAGADITYCEESVGHKLGMDCYRRLGEFFS
jgi:phospholipase/carboxylesterase